MVSGQVVIPIAQVSSASACSSGPVTMVGGSCSSAASCSSCSSCSSGGAAADSNDPSVKLAQQGWILRTTIGEPRLSEVVDNYRAMGYQVHVEHFGPIRTDASTKEGDAACTTCFDAADRTKAAQAWGSVYVRPGRAPDHNDELF